MDRYRSYGAQDDQPAQIGDNALLGVDEYNAPENIKPGNVQNAVNVDFSPQDATTRGGFVCLPELGSTPFGQVWTYHQIAASTATFSQVAFGNTSFVATGGAGLIYLTQDGITWTAGGTTNLLAGSTIGFGNSVFIAGSFSLGVGYSCLARSSDGITWTNPTIGTQIGVASVAYGNGLWVAVGSDGNLVSPKYATSVSSDNGLTWTSTIHTSFGTGLFERVFFANGVFIASDAFHIWRSSDGVSWTQLTLFLTDGIVGMAFGNGKFVALGSGGSIYLSTDAILWTKYRDGDGQLWTSIVFGNGVFAAFAFISGGDNVMYSVDGATWIKTLGVPDYGWASATYANGLWLAVGGFGASMVCRNLGTGIFASGLFSDPTNSGNVSIMLVAYDQVGFFASGRTGRSVSLGGNYVTQQSTIVQANNQVYLFRGTGETPLYWDGNWNGSFVPVPNTSLPSSFNSIPASNQATFYQNRLWVVDGKDEIAASDILAFTDYDPLANELSTNTGNSDYVVATFPFGQNSLIAFKNKSIQLLQNCEGSLSDVTVTEITRQVGLIGINAVCSVGPDLAYASYGNINLLTLTSTNNSLQHKTLPLSAKIRKIMDRVNWQYGYKISMGYWNNKLYVAIPLDNSIYCNGVIVYNFITENWYGEWNFSESMNMCIQGFQVLDYLGLQRLHAITEDGRIFVTDEGYQDISGTTVAEIAYDLTTRAYDTNNLIHFQRRMFMDIGTIRPSYSVYAYTEGANEVSTLIEDQTYSRSESWKFADTDYTLTNANDDYNRPYRKDYSTGPDSIQCGTGFQPEMYQEYRFPLLTRRQGRLTWLQVTNAQGYLKLMSIGAEARMGQRSSLVTV